MTPFINLIALNFHSLSSPYSSPHLTQHSCLRDSFINPIIVISPLLSIFIRYHHQIHPFTSHHSLISSLSFSIRYRHHIHPLTWHSTPACVIHINPIIVISPLLSIYIRYHHHIHPFTWHHLLISSLSFSICYRHYIHPLTWHSTPACVIHSSTPLLSFLHCCQFSFAIITIFILSHDTIH